MTSSQPPISAGPALTVIRSPISTSTFSPKALLEEQLSTFNAAFQYLFLRILKIVSENWKTKLITLRIKNQVKREKLGFINIKHRQERFVKKASFRKIWHQGNKRMLQSFCIFRAVNKQFYMQAPPNRDKDHDISYLR